jgi:N-acetylglucosamine-6-phosphate deacetylase
VRIAAADYRTGAVSEFDFNDGSARVARSARSRASYISGPGFVDLQCNGFAGVDFTRPETTPEQVCQAVRAIWKSGCASVLATVITASPERLEALLRTLVVARKIDAEVRRSIPGFHLEGPFISEVDGARGAHPREHVRPPDPKLWRRLQKAAEGLIRIVTVAPEVNGAIRLIRQLRSENVLVALGHTMATREQIAAAAAAGAVMSTHLGNGCPQMLHRHENPVLAQLGEDALAASFIADGIHLPLDVLRTFVRAKGSARTVLVTDAMSAAGAPPGRYTIGDLVVEVGKDRVVRQLGCPNFAGSALTMNDAVANTARSGALELADAWAAASTTPAKLLQRFGGIRVNPAQIVARKTEKGLEIRAVIRSGRVAYGGA